METSQTCSLGKKCLVHGFKPVASKLLVSRAFSLIVDQNFTIEEQRFFWSVAHGKR
jgi:hypothetical protein